ncbi:hypothetical protein LPJ78_000572 [Coemansia sp. RSA 989]|nr:hypothetical protein LPJ78_000572 [Coemansia sp. RSA 989]KAJ1871273.1 hypothetical protein LPJ55_004012 [Coemansia sp. RSA 990]KAJ2653149.1 hypothetical protein IWW40_000803 [Coemansia sp. RSA 1250]
MALQNLFVPRARIATFEVALRIEDLNNVPPLNGMFYAKWRCQTHSGTSPRVPVANQQVQWSHAVRRTVDIPVGRDGVLAPCELRIAIRQEVYSHMRMKIGALTVNLSEYARLSGSSRRYFLQECKLNCTLKLSIAISQTSGPDDYDVPPLDRSMVLTDLNDIVTSESSVRPRDAASGGNSLSSAHPSRRTAHLSSSSHSTGRSATTETSHSRGLLPIDNTNIRELAPFQRSSRKNQQIVDDIFSLSL